ncbi:MAG: ATP-binding protein [Victivallales bacterium]|nr:ATP-binding protein [Victivallales bacterium]
MIPRHLATALQESLAEYPVVTIFGPRQSGKTTLARTLCPHFRYANLEDKETRDLAVNDYKAFFARFPPPVIIDEIQRVPELTSAVQVRVDEERGSCGRFVLTGSHQTALAASIDQSLAGRTSILELLPLSLAELGGCPVLSTDQLLLTGFMPELHLRPRRVTNYYRNYFRTYVERDVRQLENIRDLLPFERFVTLLAGRVGQLVNYTALSCETGVSVPTITSWLSILEASFLILRLPPYFSNISKRVVKSPKIYFTEPGLAAYLLGIETPAQMATHPLRGNLFENLVVVEALKHFANQARNPQMAFLRTEKGFEIDLLLSHGDTLQPVEIKSAMTFRHNLIQNLEIYCRHDQTASHPLLVYDGEALPAVGTPTIQAVNFRTCQEAILPAHVQIGNEK